ncbi:hypothetical protein AD998_15460 [bacterium 336/3]|nr:hypothetical protein AD998_15460 [bacterium 336/3]
MLTVQLLDVFYDILSNKKSGIVEINAENGSCHVNIYQGEFVIDLDKSLFMKVMSDNIKEFSFKESNIDKTFNFYPLLNLLWDFSNLSLSFSDDFYKNYLNNHIIGKTSLNDIYKLGNQIGIDTLLVYLFFSKSENRTFKDLLDFYSYKSPQDLKSTVYRLFIIGQLKVLGNIIQENNVQKDNPQLSNKNIALQKLLNKISNL